MKMQCAEEQQHEDSGQSAIRGDAIELTAMRTTMQPAEEQQYEDSEQSAILGDAIELTATCIHHCAYSQEAKKIAAMNMLASSHEETRQCDESQDAGMHEMRPSSKATSSRSE